MTKEKRELAGKFIVAASIAAGLAAVLVSGLPHLAGQDAGHNDSFFPERPKGAKVEEVTGTLLEYGIGNKSGSFSIRDAWNHTKEFYVGSSMHIGDQIVKCAIPPVGDRHADPRFCNDWPENVKLGQTAVRVFYWNSEHDGKQVLVSDAIAPVQAP